MKNTKTMILGIVVFFITWLLIALFGWLISDITYKECFVHSSVISTMIIFGWIPALIVCADYNEYSY